jgi:RHS repeat-associated protein
MAPLTTNYTYDQADRLTTYNAGPNATTYAYNGDGLRMTKASTLVITHFSWDIGVEAGLPLLMQDSAGSYIYGPGGMLLEEVVGSSVYYYHTDRLGSIRALTSSTGGVANTYTYDDYGKTLTSTGSVYNPFKYTGEYTDAESGFVYLRAWYYDPESQQFLIVDPALAWTEQAYAYVSGNPTNLRDPWGLDGCGLFPNFFDETSCIRVGLGTPAGPWVVVAGVVAATGGAVCLLGGCEAIAVALGIGAAAVESESPAIVNELAPVAENETVQICEENVRHIFRVDIAHFAEDTAENRQALIDTVRDAGNYVQTDSQGVETYRRMLPDGRQIWAEVFKGEITNGGVNNVPRR